MCTQIKNPVGYQSYFKAFLFSKFIPIVWLLLFALNQRYYPQVRDVFFEQIFLDQGLSQSIVKCILQDNRGFMYFGTEDGLNIYDGYKFTILRNDPNDTNSLSYNDINTLFEDHNKIIWIGTFNAGLNSYNPSDKKFTRYVSVYGDSNSLSQDNVNSIVEDKNGNIWVGTDIGLNKINSENIAEDSVKFRRFFCDKNNSRSISNNIIMSLLADRQGNLWIGTSNGLNKISYKEINFPKPNFKRFNFTNDRLENTIIRCLFEDSEGELWIGTDDGLFRLKNPNDNSKKPKFISYRNQPNKESSISNNLIYAICEDKSGNIWIGTNGGGINIFDKRKNKFVHYIHDPLDKRSLHYDEIRSIYRDKSGIMWIGTYGAGIDKVSRGVAQFYHYTFRANDENSLSNAIVWSIYEDKDSILWIGTHNGLDRLDRKINKYSHFQQNPKIKNGLQSNIIRNVVKDKNGNLWLGTHGGGVNIFNPETNDWKLLKHKPGDPNTISSNEIRYIFLDGNDLVWIGTYGYGLDCLNIKTWKVTHFRNIPNDPNSLSNNFVRIIYKDRSGDLWVGTEGGGLDKFDKNELTFKSYRANTQDKNALSNDYIFSIHEDGSGYLWLSTFGGGLNRFNPKTESFKSFKVEDGLSSNAIYGILEDDNQNLWLSTNQGLSKFNLKTETFKNYSFKDGLQSNEFNGGSFFKSKSGELFFGGINGFNAFYPNSIKNNDYIPPVVLTSFLKFNKHVKFDHPLNEMTQILLSHEDYIFAFEFAALDYTAPEKNQYAYKMIGLDKDWIYVDAKKRYADYTTLSPGSYTFMVKGSNSDGIWNEAGASINLYISPPYWKTWWFSTLAVIFIGGLGFIFYKRRLINMRMKFELQTAHDVQMAIMPQKDPVSEKLEVSGICEPANEVGGDFFDYFWLENEKSEFGVLIGDVSGKAMKAAMTAIMSNGMILSETRESNKINEIFNRVSESLFDKTDKQTFVAACIAAFDAEERKLILTNAGSINPLYKSKDNIEYLKSSDPRFPLGLVKNVEYKIDQFDFKPEDIFVFITDGITDAQNKLKEQYGFDRLSKFLKELNTIDLSAHEIRDSLIENVKKFSGGSHFDDMTVVVVKIL